MALGGMMFRVLSRGSATIKENPSATCAKFSCMIVSGAGDWRWQH
jgi:hypothetical protein